MTAADETPLVLVTPRDLTAAQRDLITSAAPGADVRFCEDEDELRRSLEHARVVAGPLTPEHFSRAGRLTWLHSWRAGADELLFDALVRSDVILTNSSGNGAIPLAEHALMLMLMLNRGMPEWMREQEQRHWARREHGELTGLTCGIIGLGEIGGALARMLSPHDVRVIGLRRHPAPVDHVHEVVGHERLDYLLAESDFVVVTAPLTPATRGMLGAAQFGAMKPTAHYIALSRGGIAADDALLRALNEGWIAGAGLDAHSEEPLPPESPFWTARNTLVTPHNGATTPLVVERSVRIFAENLRRYAGGEPLLNVVDKHEGY